MASPVRATSSLGRVLVLVLTPVCLLGPRAGGTQTSPLLDRARDEAAHRVEARWGDSPQPSDRLGGRRLLHAACILGFVAFSLPALVLFGIGTGLDLAWSRVVGACFMVPASCFLGFDAGMLLRSFGTHLDFYEWDRAGRPDSWKFREWSQPRGVDLVGAATASFALSAFFLVLMLQ